MYHGLLGGYLHDHVGVFVWHHVPWRPLADLFFFLGVAGPCVAIAVASFHLFEQPLLRFKRFFPEPPAGGRAPPGVQRRAA